MKKLLSLVLILFLVATLLPTQRASAQGNKSEFYYNHHDNTAQGFISGLDVRKAFGWSPQQFAQRAADVTFTFTAMRPGEVHTIWKSIENGLVVEHTDVYYTLGWLLYDVEATYDGKRGYDISGLGVPVPYGEFVPSVWTILVDRSAERATCQYTPDCYQNGIVYPTDTTITMTGYAVMGAGSKVTAYYAGTEVTVLNLP